MVPASLMTEYDDTSLNGVYTELHTLMSFVNLDLLLLYDLSTKSYLFTGKPGNDSLKNTLRRAKDYIDISGIQGSTAGAAVAIMQQATYINFTVFR